MDRSVVAESGQKQDGGRVNDFATKANFVGGHLGVVVGGNSGGHVSVCSVFEGFSEENSILQRNGVVSSQIRCVCPISESVVCLGCKDHTCYFYDFIQNKRLSTLEGHAKWVNSVAYSSASSILYSGSSDTTIRLWRVADDYSQSQEIHQLTGDQQGGVTYVRSREEIWSHRLLSGCLDRTGRIWDLRTQKEISVLRGHTHWVLGIDLSSNGDYIATGSFDGTVCLWDTNGFERQATVKVGENVCSLFCAQKRLNTIVVGGIEHVFIFDPRNMSNGPVNMLSEDQHGTAILEIDSNRFVHNEGQVLRNYDGRILRKWDIRPSLGCCFVQFDEEEPEFAEEALAFALEARCFSVVIVFPDSVRRLGCWRCIFPLEYSI